MNIKTIVLRVVTLFSPIVSLARHVPTFNKRLLSPSAGYCNAIIWEIIILMTG